MTSGEDLLLLAIAPRTGAIREPDRIRFALRAAVLVDLALAHRITLNTNRIKVLDEAPTGDKMLDGALASLSATAAPSLRAWIRGTPAGYGMINRYLSILADQGVVQIEHHRHPIPAPMRTTLIDRTRRAAAKARLDRVARAGQSEDADRALAGLVHACGLDRHLYRLSPFARARISRLGSHQDVADHASAAAADAATAQAVAEAISDGISRLTAEMVRLLNYEYRLEHQAAGHHDLGSGHHHGGASGDSGSGHHHH